MIVPFDTIPCRNSEPPSPDARIEEGATLLEFRANPTAGAWLSEAAGARAGIPDLRLQLRAAVLELDRARQALIASGFETVLPVASQLEDLMERSMSADHMIDRLELRLPAVGRSCVCRPSEDLPEDEVPDGLPRAKWRVTHIRAAEVKASQP